MKHHVALGCAAICAIVFSFGAAAQQAGTYYGTSADGQTLNFTVGTDPNTNSLAVVEVNISFDATCSGGNPDVQQSWGIGYTQDITNRKVSYLFAGQDIYLASNMIFAKDGSTVSGTINTRIAGFAPSTGAPLKSEFCQSAKQAFTATFQSGAAKTPPLANGETVHYPPK